MVYRVTYEKKNKYNSKSSYYAGRWFHSVFEANYARTLDTLKKASNVSERVVAWWPQFKVSLVVNGDLICNYYVDFKVEYADGHIELHETKGYETDVWKLKVKLLEATYLKDNPEVEYKVIKQNGIYKRYNQFKNKSL